MPDSGDKRMPLTQYYHTRDPIENLRIHVTLRKKVSTHLLSSTCK